MSELDASSVGEHTLDERIAAATDLAPAERKVARFFSDSGAQVMFLPASKIAAALGVSTATVVRTAQRLGYAGLPELKDELQEAVLQRHETPVERLKHNLDDLTADLGALPQNLLAIYARLFTAAGRALRAEDFVRVVSVLGEADRIIVYSQPPYGFLGEHFAMELRRYGRRSHAIGVRQGQTAEELIDIGPGDVLVVLAYFQVTTTADVVLDRAQDRQVPCVLVTDTLALALKGRYTIALSAPRDDPTMHPTATVPLAVIEAVLLGVIAHDKARSLAGVATRDQLRSRLT